MTIDAKWWVLYEDEHLDLDHSRIYELREGTVLDGRTGEKVGTYSVDEFGADLTLDDEPGDNTVVQFRTGREFDPSFNTCTVNWTTSGFELYRSSWPVPDDETEEAEREREDWENQHFGQRVTYGTAFRDGPIIRKLHDHGQRVWPELQ